MVFIEEKNHQLIIKDAERKEEYIFPDLQEARTWIKNIEAKLKRYEKDKIGREDLAWLGFYTLVSNDLLEEMKPFMDELVENVDKKIEELEGDAPHE